MLHPLGPGHFGDVDEAFDALLQLDERAVVGDRKDAAVDLRADGVALDGVEPRVRRELLEAERDALLFLVELEHLHLDLIANIDEVARVSETAPAHVGDVEQAIEAAHIDERAVVGEVLDDAGEDGAFFEGGERDCLLRVLLFFEDFLAGDDDVAALLVQLDDADFDLGADVAVEVADGANFNLRAGQECLDADVDGEAALDARDDHALDGGLGVGSLFELVPNLVTQGLLVADEIAAFLLFALHDDFDHVAHVELGRAGVVENLIQRNETLGLEADVDDGMLVGDLDDGAGDDSLFGGHEPGRRLFRRPARGRSCRAPWQSLRRRTRALQLATRRQVRQRRGSSRLQAERALRRAESRHGGAGVRGKVVATPVVSVVASGAVGSMSCSGLCSRDGKNCGRCRPWIRLLLGPVTHLLHRSVQPIRAAEDCLPKRVDQLDDVSGNEYCK